MAQKTVSGFITTDRTLVDIPKGPWGSLQEYFDNIPIDFRVKGQEILVEVQDGYERYQLIGGIELEHAILIEDTSASESRRQVKVVSSDIAILKKHANFIVHAVSNNIDLTLPSASETKDLTYTFRLAEQASGYAMTVHRSGDDVIKVNGEDQNLITSDVLGFHFSIVSDGENYHLMTRSNE